MDLNLVWIIYKSKSETAAKEALVCSKRLISLGIKVETYETGVESNYLETRVKSNKDLPNLAIVLGGDGTVLGAARYLAIYQVPILSFNVGGNLGFLTHDKKLLNSNDLWEIIREDHFTIECRMMLQASLKIQSNENELKKESVFWALNDFYFRSYRDEISPTCSLELKIDGEEVDQYRGDGLIVSSPTGSTAYAMATGGPILHPDIQAIIVSAICPMSLSSRPIVIPGGSRLTITPLGDNSRRVKLWQDGVSTALIKPGDQCLIQKARHNAQMVILQQSPSYYSTLAKKLYWAGSFSK